MSADSSTNTLASLKERGWVTLRDFCYLAEVTYPTGLRWCKLKMINYVQVGGSKRIYHDEIERFMRMGTRPGDPEGLKLEKEKRLEYAQNRMRKLLGPNPNPNPNQGDLS